MELAMSHMPKVVRELPSKIDIMETFFASPNRADKATSMKCGLTHLASAMLEHHVLPEEGGVLGMFAVRNMFCF